MNWYKYPSRTIFIVLLILLISSPFYHLSAQGQNCTEVTQNLSHLDTKSYGDMLALCLQANPTVQDLSEAIDQLTTTFLNSGDNVSNVQATLKRMGLLKGFDADISADPTEQYGSPFFFTGDLNGDKKKDCIFGVIVQSSVSRFNLIVLGYVTWVTAHSIQYT